MFSPVILKRQEITASSLLNRKVAKKILVRPEAFLGVLCGYLCVLCG
jgi:hypothetical protein